MLLLVVAVLMEAPMAALALVAASVVANLLPLVAALVVTAANLLALVAALLSQSMVVSLLQSMVVSLLSQNFSPASPWLFFRLAPDAPLLVEGSCHDCDATRQKRQFVSRSSDTNESQRDSFIDLIPSLRSFSEDRYVPEMRPLTTRLTHLSERTFRDLSER